MAQMTQTRPALRAKPSALSLRHRQVLNGIALGRSNDHMALDLRLSSKTIQKHRASLYRRFDVNSAPALVLAAVRTGALKP